MKPKTVTRIGLVLLALTVAAFIGSIWSPDEIKDQILSTSAITLLAGLLMLFVGSYAHNGRQS